MRFVSLLLIVQCVTAVIAAVLRKWIANMTEALREELRKPDV